MIRFCFRDFTRVFRLLDRCLIRRRYLQPFGSGAL
jgi:hypothetical protein